MKEKSVSVIIPCHNGAKFLPEAIGSILAQTYPPSEIIVVDDGSTDNSAEIAAAYFGVRVIRQENQGVAASRNTGLRKSRGDFLVFIDQDDRLLPNAFQVGMDCLNAHPDCGFVFGLYRLIGADGKPWPDRLQWQIQIAPYPEIVSYEALLSCKIDVQLSSVMFQRTVFESIRGFDPSVDMADDYDICLRIARTFPIYCHNQIISEYRQHGSNCMRDHSHILKVNLRVFNAQRSFVEGNDEYKSAWVIGREQIRRGFGRDIPYEVVRKIRGGQFIAAFRAVCVGLRYYPQGIFGFPLVLLRRLVKYHSLRMNK